MLVATLAAVLPLAGAAAPGEQVVSGSLVAGSIVPTSALSVFLVGTTPTDGVDARFVPLARVADGDEPVRLAWESDVPAALRVRFFRDGWHSIGDHDCSGATRFPGVTAGVVECLAPPGADHALIEIYHGASARYELRYVHG